MPLFVPGEVAEKLEAELRSNGFTRLADELHESIEKAKVVGVPEPWEGDSPCEECGGANACWFAPNRIWNAVMGDDKQKTLCINCFAKRAYERGYTSAWMLVPEQENDAVIQAVIEAPLVASYSRFNHDPQGWAVARNIVATVLAYFKDAPWPGYAMHSWDRLRNVR